MTEAELKRRALNISDLREMAKRRLPKVVFEYVDGGAEDGWAHKRNRAAFERMALVPRVLNDVSKVDTSKDLFGSRASLPIGVTATGGGSMYWYDGDTVLARGARAVGVPFMISGAATTPPRKIAEAGGRLWYQYYVPRDRAVGREVLAEAQALGCEALVVTVDTAASPNREYNEKNGLTWPLKITARNVGAAMANPHWGVGVALRYMAEGGFPGNDPKRVMGTANFTWEELAEVRRAWSGPLLVKGVLSPLDARRVIESGCDGVIVSNHGGRNLDHAVATLDALPGIVEAVNGRGLVALDSGVRRGGDVLKALAIGADFVFVGRAVLYGLAAAGQPGVERALNILGEELKRDMGFCGCASVEEIGRELIFGAEPAVAVTGRRQAARAS